MMRFKYKELKQFYQSGEIIPNYRANEYTWVQAVHRFLSDAPRYTDYMVKMYGEFYININAPTLSAFSNELVSLGKSFIDIYGDVLQKIYDTKSVEFNPVENYDRYEDTTTNFNGGQTNTNTPTGSRKTEVEYTGTEKDTVKNNQSITSADSSDSYHTNRVMKNETFYSGDADENTHTFTNRKDSTTETFDNYNDVNTFIYNNRSDVISSHIHGNIGVTTGTQLLTEYVDYFKTHSFFAIMFDMYVAYTIDGNIYSETYDYFD